MKRRLTKAQKGLAKITKKIPKPKLPSRTVTKGRSGKFYETDSYAKEGLKQALKKRDVIKSGDLKKVKKFLKNPNITKQDQLDFFKQALENNPKMKLYQKGGFTPPPSGVIDPRKRPKTFEDFYNPSKIYRPDLDRGRGYTPGPDLNTEEDFREFIEERRNKIRPRPGTGAILDGNRHIPSWAQEMKKYRSGGNTYHAKMFRRSRKH